MKALKHFHSDILTNVLGFGGSEGKGHPDFRSRVKLWDSCLLWKDVAFLSELWDQQDDVQCILPCAKGKLLLCCSSVLSSSLGGSES